MKKIKLKDTHPYSSVANRFFSIEKGMIVTVDNSFPVDENVFDVVEINGKPVKIERQPLNDIEIEGLLGMTQISNFKDKLVSLDLDYGHLQQLLARERQTKKRREFVDYLERIPKPVDRGIKLTSDVLFKNELMAIPKVNEKTAAFLVSEYKSRDDLINDLKKPGLSGAEKALNRDVLDELKKHFKFVKSVVTTKKIMFGGK